MEAVRQARISPARVVLCGAWLLPAVHCAGAIQYDLIVLPQGAAAYAVNHGQVVGVSRGNYSGLFWPTPNTVLTIGGGFTKAGIAGNQIVAGHALIVWQGGSALSFSDLGAGAVARAIDGAQFGGAVNSGDGEHPSLWNETTGPAYVDLTPPGFLPDGEVAGVWGGVQVGDFGGQAAYWRGTPSSYVNLNPFNLTTASAATGVSHGQIVGEVGLSPASVTHAGIWTRPTNAGFVDLNPPSATSSRLNGTNGTQQVGYYTLQPAMPGNPLTPGDQHPAVWSGTAASVQTLLLPSGYPYGAAEAIDSDGDIAGYATTSQGGQEPMVALLWVPHRLPGDANFDGKVDFQDLMTLARHYGQSGDVGWVDGDFDMDGSVGFDDLVTLARNYGATAPTASQLAQFDPAFRAEVERAFADVPEPSAPALLLAAASLGLPRLRRRPGGD